MSKLRVWMSQINNTFGHSAFLPYSCALLQAYALKDDVIREHYQFCGFVFLREGIQSCVARLGKVDVFAASVYIWNARITLALAKAVKEAHPDCLIVLGGPHVPVRSEGFFQKHPWADVLIHYEGEETFREVLREHLHRKSYVNDGFVNVTGVSLDAGGGQTFKTPDRPRMTDLDQIPSPYLTGLFDGLMELDYDMHPTYETDRGCPFFCQFCDWGSSVYTKVRKFPLDRLKEELRWFSYYKVDLVYGADANFAMYDAHVELTEEMVRLNRNTGYPKKFRAAYAKNSGDRVFKVSKLLADAGMSKGTTLSFQSMNPTVLELVKRKNIDMSNFKGLIDRYRDARIPTYSEIIIGLPGETYDSFADGLDTLIDAGQHESLNVYIAELLPNSEMSAPEYRERHSIQSVVTPQLFYHATPSEDNLREEYELVTATKSLPPEDWMRCCMFSWVVQSLHCMGAIRLVAIFMRHYAGMSYRTFYEQLLNHVKSDAYHYAHKRLGVLYSLCRTARNFYSEMRQGRTPELIDLRFGNITWPPEEFTYLLACAEHEAFYREVLQFLMLLDVSERTAIDIVYIQSQRCPPPPEGGEEEWAKREVWYGRKGRTTLTDELLQQVIQLARDCAERDKVETTL